MQASPLRRVIWIRLALTWAGCVWLLLAVVGLGQTTLSRGKSQAGYPRLPGAIIEAPASIAKDAPFDVSKHFQAVAREQNAAPLYLDALFEFGSELEVCFPEGPERTRRTRAARDRSKRYRELTEKVFADRNEELDPAAVDEVIASYAAGYRKLAEAQRLARCVFETGISLTTLLPHAQVSRQVARISYLKVQRAVQHGDIIAAIREVETVLRLARDLRPRGALVTQLVCDANTNFVDAVILPVIISSPRTRSEHCDRLIKVFLNHETKSVDGYAEGLRGEYVQARTSLAQIIHEQEKLSKAYGVKAGESVVRAIVALGGPPTAPGSRSSSTSNNAADLDSIVSHTSRDEESRLEKELVRYFRELLALDGLPFARRIERAGAVKPPVAAEPLAKVVRVFVDPARMEAVTRSQARTTANMRATLCLVALRQRRLAHRSLPKTVTSLIQGTALKTIPIDPYDGRPMKMAIIDGAPVIYSVGRDGKDDGGLIDAGLDQKPVGDLLYRLPAVEDKPKLKP